MVGRPLVEPQAQEGAHGQRVGRAPRDAALRIEPFEIADQQQAEVPAGGEARPPQHRRVERATLRLDKAVEARGVEDPVQPHVERVPRRDRQFSRWDPQRRLLALVFAHRHGPQCTISLVGGDSLSPTFTTGC